GNRAPDAPRGARDESGFSFQREWHKSPLDPERNRRRGDRGALDPKRMLAPREIARDDGVELNFALGVRRAGPIDLKRHLAQERAGVDAVAVLGKAADPGADESSIGHRDPVVLPGDPVADPLDAKH